MKIYSHSAGITGTSITFSLAPGTYLFVEPALQVTVFGGATELDAEFVWEAISGVGEVITGVTLTFPSALIGKRFSLLLVAE